MNIVVLNKALFYLDLAALRDTGETVTGAKYVALDHGPVVSRYQQQLVKPLEHHGLAHQDEQGLSKPVRLDHLFDGVTFPEAISKKIREVADWTNLFSSTALSDFAHLNLGWQIAYKRGQEQGRPAAVIDLTLAMQQLVEEDDWLDESLSAEEAALFDAAQHEELLPL